MTIQEVKESYGCELLTMDGYDDCIVGVATRVNQIPFIIYNYDKVIAKLMNQGMTYHEAVDFHEFNQASAWVGESTPAFLHKIDE
jgi:hypothetical protein